MPHGDKGVVAIWGRMTFMWLKWSWCWLVADDVIDEQISLNLELRLDCGLFCAEQWDMKQRSNITAYL